MNTIYRNRFLFAMLTILVGFNYACSKEADSKEDDSVGTTYGTIIDIEGNSYKTIQIGEQIWMAENLMTSTYNDGAQIPNIIDDKLWQADKGGAYCWYDNDISNKVINGALYNWYAASSDKLCPDGWHIPSDNEWSMLLVNASATAVNGVSLNKSGWNYSYKSIEDSLNYKGPLSGYRNRYWEVFEDMGVTDFYWLNYDYSESMAYAAHTGSSACSWGSEEKNCGFSVRCIRD